MPERTLSLVGYANRWGAAAIEAALDRLPDDHLMASTLWIKVKAQLEDEPLSIDEREALRKKYASSDLRDISDAQANLTVDVIDMIRRASKIHGQEGLSFNAIHSLVAFSGKLSGDPREIREGSAMEIRDINLIVNSMDGHLIRIITPGWKVAPLLEDISV